MHSWGQSPGDPSTSLSLHPQYRCMEDQETSAKTGFQGMCFRACVQHILIPLFRERWCMDTHTLLNPLSSPPSTSGSLLFLSSLYYSAL